MRIRNVELASPFAIAPMAGMTDTAFRRLVKRHGGNCAVDRDAARCRPGPAQEVLEMILVDTGPLVALFDPKDRQHGRCVDALKGLREALATTTPVLTEGFHMLGPDSIGSDRLREFVEQGGLDVWFFNRATLTRAFELVEMYADHPMDLADACSENALDSVTCVGECPPDHPALCCGVPAAPPGGRRLAHAGRPLAARPLPPRGD